MKNVFKKQDSARSFVIRTLRVLMDSGIIIAIVSRPELKIEWAITIIPIVALLHIAKEGFNLRRDECTKRRELGSIGVYGKIIDHDLCELRVHKSHIDDREFALREVKEEVDELISRRTPVLIVGPSMSGKTRLAVESLRTVAPEYPLWFPSSDEAIEKVLDLGYEPGKKTTIFLDDIDRFLSNRSLEATTFRLWEKNNCIIVATLQNSKFSKLVENGDNYRVLNTFRIVKISSLMSDKELLFLENSSYKELIPHIKQFGLAPLLGGAKIALDKYHLGEEERSWGSWCQGVEATRRRSKASRGVR